MQRKQKLGLKSPKVQHNKKQVKEQERLVRKLLCSQIQKGRERPNVAATIARRQWGEDLGGHDGKKID